MVSMFSLHFIRWAEQLNDSGHEVHWIDVFDSNTPVKEIDFIHQIVGWKRRVNYPGRYWIKNKLPGINEIFSYVNERELSKFVDQKIKEVNPDIVHSFILQSATIPILKVMKYYPNIKWVYSAWGNDLYYRQQNKRDLEDIKRTLPALDYMFADCTRDYYLARQLGFKGKYLGTFPTGGGYSLESFLPYVKKFDAKNILVIKGYQGKLGRCDKVLEALLKIKEVVKGINIVLFAVTDEVKQYAHTVGLTGWDNFEIKPFITHKEVLELMGSAKIYIGNSISDGLPNTLLEAIIMEVFPIQSNPGGATSELIADGKNGLLIEEPEDPNHIASLIKRALADEGMMRKAIAHNNENIRPFLDRNLVKMEVEKQYEHIAESL